ncbi:MAG TPA: signal peptidase II [Stellaceae bacterium]|jgi:signal peptidase II|nr:signal peptidase II [Stellaceae bacterium]
MLGRGLAVALVVAVADQLSKLWILRLFAAHPGARVFPVAPFFNLALVWNRGMSFGLFDGDARLNTVVFTALAALIVTGLVLWLRRVRQPLLVLAIGLVIGGAVGNVIDRLLRGAVVDFLDFYLGQWHFYVFNLADSAISVGVGLMVLDSMFQRGKASN